MTVAENAENLRQYEIQFCLIAEKILVFALHPCMVGGVKNLSPNFKRTT